jgi:DedD protein
MAMEQTIKQRLIGAIVLVALAVIFLPSILGRKNERKTYHSKIPPIEATTEAHSTGGVGTGDNADSLTSFEQSRSTVDDLEREQKEPANGEQISLKTQEANQQGADHKATTKTGARQLEDTQGKGTEKNSLSEAKSSKSSNEPSLKSPEPIKTEPNSSESDLFSRDSWVIQVGSFSSHANAELLAKRLEEHQLKSFVRPIDLKDKPLLYRVYVGPWLTKEQADSALPKVSDVARLKPIVVKWRPNQQ